MIIRDYKMNDIAGLCDLMNDLGYPTNLESMKNRMGLIQSNSMYFTFVAEVNDEIIGMIGVRQVYSYENDGLSTQISALVVKKEFQGKGIGKRLVGFVENWALMRRSKVLFLTSGLREERLATHEFYKSIGFQITGYRFVKKIM
jgi:GNAT superfamily N-acetyltransferase